MYIVDRIEENYVVLEAEDKTMQDVESFMFPEGIKAGDVVRLIHGQYVIDEEATKERANQIKTLMNSLWEEE